MDTSEPVVTKHHELIAVIKTEPGIDDNEMLTNPAAVTREEAFVNSEPVPVAAAVAGAVPVPVPVVVPVNSETMTSLDNNPDPSLGEPGPGESVIDNPETSLNNGSDGREEGAQGGEEEEDEENDEDDDDDDDIKITIGEIKATTPPYSGGAYAPINFNIAKRGPAFGPGGQVTTNSGTKGKSGGLNVDAVATYEGTSIYELNLDTLEEKPWRKPGADITDYFNYGFTEETWKLYCEKQRKIQQEIANGLTGNDEPRRNSNILGDRTPGGPHANGGQPISTTPHSTPGTKGPGAVSSNSESPIPVASVNENSKYSGMGLTKKAGPPPGRKTSGTIDVIGGGTPSTPSVITSRRPPDTPEASFNQMMATVPPGPGMPPPGPFHYPPPPFGIPPPHAAMDFLPPHPMAPRGMNPPVMGNVQPSTSYPPPHMVDYGLLLNIKRERDEDREEIDRREKSDRDKREREERDRRDKRRERDDRDKRDRRDKEKHIKKERRDDRDRDRDDKDKRDRRSDRDKSERRHRDERDDRHDDKKRKKSESEGRDRDDREKRERREREEKEKR